MSKRAEIRRLQRQTEKREKLANNVGLNEQGLANLTAMIEKDAHDRMYREFCIQFNDHLYESELYVSLANIIVSCIALHMTWGYTKAIGRFIENINPARDYVKRIGVKKAYEQVCKEYDLDIKFDHFDIEDFIKRAEEAEKAEEDPGR